MEDERNTQYTQGGETQEQQGADQVEVNDRGFLGSLLGRKKAPEDQEKKQEEELVSGIENVKVSEPEPEPEKHDEAKKEEHHDHEGGEKKESLLDKLHRSSSSSSSSSDEEEEEEVIDENGEIVKRKKKKGLKEKIKGKLPGRKDKPDADVEHKPYTPSPPTPIPTHETEYKPNDDHKAYIPATAPPTNVPLTTTHVHSDDNATVVQKVEETPQKGLLEKIKEKLPGGHKKPEDAAAALDAEEVSSPTATEKKQGLLGKIMDKIPGYNKTPAEEDHKPASAAAAAGEHKADH